MNFINTYEELQNKAARFIIKVERDYSVKPKHFTNGNFLNFYVRIYLSVPEFGSSDNLQLTDVAIVKYELHKSYKQPIRIAQDPGKGFEIRVWTYGYYPIKAKVYLKMGPPLEITGMVNFPISDEERRDN